MIKAPLYTDFLKLTYPDENANPFWDQFVAFVQDSERVMFFSKLFSNMWLTAGGTITWSGTDGLLTWSEDFIVPVPFWGFKINVVYGPDNATRTLGITDGSLIVITPPMALGTNITQNFQILTQLDPSRHDQFVCGMVVGTQLYLKGIGAFS